MRSDPRWLILLLLVVVCAARTGDWQTACGRACLTRIADAYSAARLIVQPADGGSRDRQRDGFAGELTARHRNQDVLLAVDLCFDTTYEWVTYSFRASAKGPLTELAGYGPDGTPGHLMVSQTGLFRTRFQGATADAFPAEFVEVRGTGK